MIEVEMNKDIREIEPKVMLGLSGRQLTFAGIGIGIAALLILIIPGDMMIRVVIGIFCGAPFLLCGWVKVFGLTLDKFIMQMIKSATDSPRRKYSSKTAFDYLDKKPTEIKKVKRDKKYKGYK